MLSKKLSSFCWVFVMRNVILFCIGNFVFSSYAANVSTLEILSLIESKKYLKASRMLEKGIARNRNKKTKGYYALLLSQLPRGVPMRKTRQEYTVMAARWATNIPVKKRMQLWIEAGDGFFKMAELARADMAYKKAFALASKYKAQSEMSYILYKRSWVQVNEKEWTKAFYFLRQALAAKKEKNKLKENILSNMGQIWVESQYFKKRIPFTDLETVVHLTALEQKKIVIQGVVKGISRIRKNGIDKVVSLFSINQELSTEILNQVLSKKTSMVPSCEFLSWMEKVEITELNKDKTLSVLNTCTKSLISKKRRSRSRKEQVKRVSGLYAQVERKGIERWPLVRIYEYAGQNNEACAESLHQLVETAGSEKAKTRDVKIKETLMESFRLCKKVSVSPVFSEKAIKALLSSNRITRNYQSTEGEWENILFHLLDMEIFYPVIRKNILKFGKAWKGKDLLPQLLLSHIQEYQPKEVKSFLNLFSPKPVQSYYLDVLLAGDFLTAVELQKWLPLSRVNSYRETVPWFRKMVSGELSMEQKQHVVAKMLKHFPSEEKDRREVSLFLSLHYLETNQVTEIFKHWDLLSSTFDKKDLAVELFEKSLVNRDKACVDLRLLPISKKVSSVSLLKFIDQCCQLINSKEGSTVSRLKLPPLLKPSALARDFVFLFRVQNRTLWLEKNISQLQDRTSRMIMDLQAAISRYQKREWKLNEAANKSETLLQKQIGLFEAELTKLAASSPHAEKYKELRNIVSQWR